MSHPAHRNHLITPAAVAMIDACAHAASLEGVSFRGSKFTNAVRVRAAAAYTILGTISAAAKETGISPDTIRSWTRRDWWHALCAEVSAANELQTRAGFAAIVRTAQAELLDRLHNGDCVLARVETTDDDGHRHVRHEPQRVPVRARDAVLAMGLAYDKQRISQNLPTSIHARTGGDVDGKLAALADKFAALSGQVNARVVSDTHTADSKRLPALDMDDT